MNSFEILKPLNEILAIAQQLVELARAEEWVAMEAVASQYEKRMTLLEDATYFKSISDANLSEEAKVIIAEIQTLNNDLDTHAVLHREKVASELRQMSQSNKALEAYSR
jgi:hypothetical protein